MKHFGTFEAKNRLSALLDMVEAGEEVTITRTFWLIMHADLRETARIRAAANFISDQVERNRSLFVRPDQGKAGAAPSGRDDPNSAG